MNSTHDSSALRAIQLALLALLALPALEATAASYLSGARVVEAGTHTFVGASWGEQNHELSDREAAENFEDFDAEVEYRDYWSSNGRQYDAGARATQQSVLRSDWLSATGTATADVDSGSASGGIPGDPTTEWWEDVFMDGFGRSELDIRFETDTAFEAILSGAVQSAGSAGARVTLYSEVTSEFIFDSTTLLESEWDTVLALPAGRYSLAAVASAGHPHGGTSSYSVSLTNIPEPGTGLLVAMGLGMMAVRRRAGKERG